jgi:hypothetical protein
MACDRGVSRRLVAVTTALAIGLAGCGSGTSLVLGSGHTKKNASPGVPTTAVRVIRGWSDALRTGHVIAAARYFRVPSVFFGGSGPPVQLRTLTDVEIANAELPCGAVFISAHLDGRYVNALFRLTNRPGPGGQAGCGSGVGETARTNFLIRNGLIVQWLRAPDEPGDNGSPKTSPTTPGATPPGSTNPQGGTTPQNRTPPPGTNPGGGTPQA